MAEQYNHKRTVLWHSRESPGEVSTSASGVEGAGVPTLVQPQPLLELIRSLALERGFNP